MTTKLKDLEYLNSLKKYLIPIHLVFFISLILGLIVAVLYPERSTNLIDKFKEIFGWITVLDPYERMLAIFENNAVNCLLAIILGIGFGIVPLFIVAINGFFLGIVILVFSQQTSVTFALAAIIPHGIIELPMILLSASIGMKLGNEVYMYFKGIFIAAVIESYVTPKIALLFYQ